MQTIANENIVTFRQYLTENEKSLATIEKYSSVITKLAAWLGKKPLTKSHMLAYRDFLQNEKALSASTMNGTLSAINAYLTLFGMEECRIRFLKLQHSAFRPEEKELTREECIRLI